MMNRADFNRFTINYDDYCWPSTYSPLSTFSPPMKKKKKKARKKKRKKKMKFNKGDKVIIRQNSEYFGKQGIDIVGKIYGFSEDKIRVGVKWSETSSNTYLEKDLEFAQPPEPEVNLWDQVVLAKEMMDAIKEAIGQENNDIKTKIFKTWGLGSVIEKGKGITMLFYGFPGTGKTMTAQAVAQHLKKKLMVVGSAEIQSSEPGGAERTIKEFFKKAKTDKSVLLFDECDSLIYNRAQVGMILAAEINCLLGEIERFDGVCILTTNNTPVLDPALERRLALKLEFPKPSKEIRFKIWEKMFPKKEALHTDVCLNTLSRYRITGGQIKNIVLNAARRAAFKGQDTIGMADFELALDREKEGAEAFAVQSNLPRAIGPGSTYTDCKKIKVADMIKKDIKREQVIDEAMKGGYGN